MSEGFTKRREPSKTEKDAQWHAFRARLELRVTEGMKREHEITTAPEEVLKRVVDGRVVIQRRGGR